MVKVMSLPLSSHLHAACSHVRERTSLVPEVAIVLGSGLGPLADALEVEAALAYEDIPGMVAASAPGHEGTLYFGTLAGRRVVAMKGRIHPYEGLPPADATFPIRLLHELGAKTLIVSNACGGLNPYWQAGDLMLQRDYINFTGQNPLIGPNDPERGPRFPVMFDAYDPEYLELAQRIARREDTVLREGVYLAISGPSYASRAELRMFQRLGADAIGMSTVHEVLVARHEGMRVLGLSVVTDMALPDGHEHADEQSVLETAAQSGERFRNLVRAIVSEL